MLCSIIDTKDGVLFVDDDSMFYEDKLRSLFIKQVPKLSRDIGETLDKFSGGDVIAKLPPDRVLAFIKRATALAEQRKQTYVAIGVEDGRLTLSFDEGTASSDEWCLVEGLNDDLTIEPIKVEALRIARALEHSDELVLDHIERHALVLRGSDPEFHYLVSGRR